MTRIDYYILPDETEAARELFACRLLHKVSKLGHHVYIHCDSEQQAQTMDTLLWQFQQNSFLPHRLHGSNDTPCAIDIGFSSTPENHDDLLVNLSQSIPRFYSRFQRVAEIVSQNPQTLAQSRENYRFYKDRNYPLFQHDMRKTR